MGGSGETPKRPRWRRWAWRTLWVGTVLVVVSLVLLQAEPLQQWAFRTGIEKALGAEADVRGLAFPSFGALYVDELTLREPGMPPFAQLTGLSVAYLPLGENGRYVTRVSVDALVLTADETRPGRSNYAFLQRLTQGSSSGGDPLRFAPREVDIKALTVNVQRADWSVQSTGLTLHAAVSAMDQVSISLESSRLEAQWTTAMLPEPVQSNGAIEILAERTPQGMDLHAALRLPEMGQLDGDVHMGMTPAGMAIEVSATDTELAESFLASLATDRLGMPVRFEAVRVPVLEVAGQYGLTGFVLGTASVNATIEGLRVGEAESPLYAGNLGVEGTRAEDDPAAMDLVLTLADGQQAYLRASLAGGAPVFTARVDDYSREALEAAIPAAWRGAASAWIGGLDGLGADVTASAAGVEGRVAPQWSLPGAAAPELRGAWLRASGEGSLTAPGLDLQFSRPSAEQFSAAMALEALPVATWYQGWTGQPMPGGLEGTLTGESKVAQQEGGAYAAQSSLVAELAQVAGFTLPAGTNVAVAGAVTASSDFLHWEGDALKADLPGVASVALDDSHLTTTPFRAASKISATADLSALGVLLGQPAWRGDAALKGTMALADGVLSGPVTLTGETLGYEDYFTPYGVPISLQGELRYRTADASGALTKAALQFGEGTDASAEAIRYQGGATAIDGLAVETDFRPVVSKGYLLEAEGHAALTMNALAVSAGALTGQGSLKATLLHAVLPDGLAAIQGGSIDARLALAGVLNADGDLKMDSLLAGGMTIRGITAKVAVEGNVVHLRRIEGTIAGGALQGEASYGPLDPTRPIIVDATLEGTDLAVFCEEMKLTDVRLTGKVSGRIRLKSDAEGLRALDASLESTEGFTVNRDLIEQALLTQLMKDSIGAGLNKRVMRTIGEASQRPFDVASLTLRYDPETERLIGSMKLESRLLDLPVDVRADVGALLDLLSLKQDGLLEGLGDSPGGGVE